MYSFLKNSSNVIQKANTIKEKKIDYNTNIFGKVLSVKMQINKPKPLCDISGPTIGNSKDLRG